jgi:hypothetical protein
MEKLQKGIKLKMQNGTQVKKKSRKRKINKVKGTVNFLKKIQ